MTSGVLEIVGNGAAFLRQKEAGYLASKNDVFVGSKLIQRYGLRTGDEIEGEVGEAPGRGKSAPLVRIDTVSTCRPTVVEVERTGRDAGRTRNARACVAS